MGYQDLSKKDTHSLKKWIVFLLVISCIITIFLYLSYSQVDHKQLRRVAELDSLIQVNFDRFNISRNQFRTHTIEIDSLYRRKIFLVNVPPGFSKTEWHYKLDKLVRPYGISTPAKVIFPEQNMRIYLVHNFNIVRTVDLRTDTSLVNQTDIGHRVLFLYPHDRFINDFGKLSVEHFTDRWRGAIDSNNFRDNQWLK